MPSSTYNFLFNIGANPACWSGSLSYFELKLLQPFPIYALEQLRSRFLYVVASNHEAKKAARAVAQMAFETEIGVSIAKIITLPPEVFTSKVCERRTYLDISTDMESFGFLINPALNSVREAGFLPEMYLQLFSTHLAQPYPKYRMCAIAALLCASAKYLIPDQYGAFEKLFTDGISPADSYAATPGFERYANDTIFTSESLNVLFEATYIDLLTPVDSVSFGHGKGFEDSPAVIDSMTTEITEISLWRSMTPPVPLGLPTGLDFRSASVTGVDDYEAYVVAGVPTSGASHACWKWNGTAWVDLSAGLPTVANLRQAWASYDGSMLVAHSDSGPLYSVNHGNSWNLMHWPPVYTGTGLWVYENRSGSPTFTIYAAANQGGIMMSTDLGGSWTTIRAVGLPVYNVLDTKCAWGTDTSHVWFGGDTSGPSVGGLYFWDGASLTNVANVRALTGIQSIYTIWGPSATDLYLGGYAFGGGNLIVHAQMDPVTHQINSAVINSLPYSSTVMQIAAIDEDGMYAAVQTASAANAIIKHFAGINFPNAWSDDGGVPNPAYQQESMAIWVNPVTGRAISVGNKGQIQTNKVNLRPGRAASPRFKKGPDTVTVADAVTVAPGKALSFSDTTSVSDGHA